MLYKLVHISLPSIPHLCDHSSNDKEVGGEEGGEERGSDDCFTDWIGWID